MRFSGKTVWKERAVAVSLFKAALLSAAILFVKWIIGKIGKKK
jgi:hypothetical protein